MTSPTLEANKLDQSSHGWHHEQPAAAGKIADLAERLNACLTDPANQTIGSLAAVLEALQRELVMMPVQSMSEPAPDWDLILSSAPLEDDETVNLNLELFVQLV